MTPPRAGRRIAPPATRRPWPLAAVLAVALAARAGYGLRYPPGGSIAALADPDAYAALAASLADSGTLSENGAPTAHREPAYPVYLGIFFKLLGKNYPAVLAANCVLGIWTLYLLHLVGARLFGESVGLAAAAVGAVYPPFIFYAAQSLRETAMAFAGVLEIFLLVDAFRKGGAARMVAAGAAGALAALTNTVMLPFALILAPAGLVALGLRRRGAVRRQVLAYGAAFVLFYSLWPLRNYLAFRTLILGSTGAGGGTFYTYLVIPQEIGGTPLQAEMMAKDPAFQLGKDLGPAAKDKLLWRMAFARISRDVFAYARLVAWRFADLWRPWPRPRNYGHSYLAIKWISILTDGWIIPLGFAGMALARMAPAEAAWIYLFVFSLNFVYALIFTMIRYRLPLMPWMILLASVALQRAWTRLAGGPDAGTPRGRSR